MVPTCAQRTGRNDSLNLAAPAVWLKVPGPWERLGPSTDRRPAGGGRRPGTLGYATTGMRIDPICLLA